MRSTSNKALLKNFRNTSQINYSTPFTIVFLLFLPLPLSAGNPDSPGAVTAPASAMYTINDVYNRLDSGSAGIKRTTVFTEPSAGPGATGHDLNEVMAKTPTVDDSDGASATEVTTGKKYWGLTSGNWGLQTGSGGVIASGNAVDADVLTGKTYSNNLGNSTGTMPNVGAQNITPGTVAQTITEGYHDGMGQVSGDSDLVTANIKSGITIFGVAGKTEVVDTTSGDAVAADLLSGKKAWVDGTEVTGNVSAGSNVSGGSGLQTFTIPDGLYSGGKTATANDPNLLTGNIKSGITIFGVAGKTEVVDTTSGDAVAADLLSGKKAWVDGSEINGTATLVLFPAVVPKTGVTLCFDTAGNQIPCAGTGQDGDLQRGVAQASPRVYNQ